LDGNGLGCRGLLARRGVALPEAGRRHGGGDRAHRRPPEPGDLVAGSARRARPAAGALVASARMDEDGFRVEVSLDDEEHGYSAEERLRAADFDDEARERLGSSVMVTRDGPRLFLYAASEEKAREAERVVRGLVAEDDLTADILVTRWHPVEEEWKDVSIPLPTTPAEERAEYAAREAAEADEARREGEFDW